MQIPTRVAFHGVPVDDEVERACLAEVERLERYFPRIVGCRVTIEQAAPRHRTGAHWLIDVRVTVPGAELVVSRHPLEHDRDEKFSRALRDAFDRIRRQLVRHSRVRGWKVKRHQQFR